MAPPICGSSSAVDVVSPKTENLTYRKSEASVRTYRKLVPTINLEVPDGGGNYAFFSQILGRLRPDDSILTVVPSSKRMITYVHVKRLSLHEAAAP